MKITQLGKHIASTGVLVKPLYVKPLKSCNADFRHRQCRGLQYHTVSQTRTGHGLPSAQEKDIDPYTIVRNEIPHMFDNIRQELAVRPLLTDIATYHFDGKGKMLRPMMSLLMAGAVNYHMCSDSRLSYSQKIVAQVSEMVHVSSLYHDDVIDGSDTRRGKPTVHSCYSARKSILGGDHIIAVVYSMLSKLKNDEVIRVLCQILVDLVEGELMQLSAKEKDSERFSNYLKKTYNKTASLLANTCKSEALVAGADAYVQEIAFQYGKNCGLAFQLVDDVLDYTPTKDLGKPNFSDLTSGIATAPVLFASEKYPELRPMIARRFQNPGDCDKALELVYASDGIQKTRFLADKHCEEAVKQISALKDSPERQGLILLTSDIVNRKK